jgi:hypothetical protein
LFVPSHGFETQVGMAATRRVLHRSWGSRGLR